MAAIASSMLVGAVSRTYWQPYSVTKEGQFAAVSSIALSRALEYAAAGEIAKVLAMQREGLIFELAGGLGVMADCTDAACSVVKIRVLGHTDAVWVEVKALEGFEPKVAQH